LVHELTIFVLLDLKTKEEFTVHPSWTSQTSCSHPLQTRQLNHERNLQI
jgi:hypothetical protein